MMTEPIQRLNPPALPDAGRIGYSQISIVAPGRIAFVSGQVAVRAEGGPVPAALAEQARIVVANARAALAALGAAPKDIALARCYVVELSPARLAEVMPALLELFDGTQPSLTGVGVAALAAPELKIELELTVRLPD